MTRSAACFVAANPAGEALLGLLTPLLEAHGCAVETPGATQRDLVRACMDADVVVFDASMEPGHIYAAATGQPMTLDHVLVVSRTHLPVNFYGLRTGGAPDYPRRWDNARLVEWVGEQLADLPTPRPDKGLTRQVRAMRSGMDAATRRANAAAQIFLSYRAGGDETARGARQVMLRGLADRVARGEFHEGAARRAFYYTPGAVAFEDELLSEARHWQVAASIDRQLATADELWIVDTPDYLGSWWTQAELMTVAYRTASGSSRPGLRRYDPTTGEVHPEPADLLPPFTKPQRKRMARWYANTDPGSMGPEGVVAIRQLGSLPLIGRLPYLTDRVWTSAFWNEALLRCPRLAPATAGPLDVERFLWVHEQPGTVRIPVDRLAPDASTWAVECPLCDSRVLLTQGPPRAVWMPIRYGRTTGPDGATLVEQPVWRASHPPG